MTVVSSTPFYAKPSTFRRWKTGPLGPYLDGFARRLWECGYSPGVGQNYIRCVGHLSRWLEQHGCKASQLDDHKLCDYQQSLKHHKDTVVSNAPYLLFLSYLRETGVIKQPRPQTVRRVDRVVNEYVEYLRRDRGLAESTLPHRRLFPQRFLEERFGNRPIRLSQLKCQDFLRYIENHASEYSPLYCGTMVAVLKDFCRFLLLHGHVNQDIAASFPQMPRWKAARLPSRLEPPEVERFLKSCDRKTPKGMRDYAILLLLVRLGLRAGEVLNLTLDDIDWGTGQITICGKGAKRNRLPLPQAVGNALVQYLQHARPLCSSRHVFIRMRAPYTGIQCASAIRKIVEKVLKRADLHPSHKGPHLLRHTFATNLLRRGASLAEVGRVLGHEGPDSTVVYAQLDQNELETVVQSWPGGAS